MRGSRRSSPAASRRTRPPATPRPRRCCPSSSLASRATPRRPRPACCAARVARRARGVLVAALAASGCVGLATHRARALGRREALPEIQRLIEADERLGRSASPSGSAPSWRATRVREAVARRHVGVRRPSRASPPGRRCPEALLRARRRVASARTTPLEAVELPRVLLRFRIEKPGYEPVELAMPSEALARAPSSSCRRPRPRRHGAGAGRNFKYRNAPESSCRLLARPLRGDEPRVPGVREARRLPRRELWKQPFVRHGTRSVLRRGDGAVPRPDRPARALDLGARQLPRGPRRLSGLRSELVRGRGLRGVRRQEPSHPSPLVPGGELDAILGDPPFSNFGGQGPRPVGASRASRPTATTTWPATCASGCGTRTATAATRSVEHGATRPTSTLAPTRSTRWTAARSWACAARSTRSRRPRRLRPRSRTSSGTSRRPRAGRTTRPSRSTRAVRLRPGDLGATVESVDDRSEHWRIEKVSFAAAYGGERIPAGSSFRRTRRPRTRPSSTSRPGAPFPASIDRVGERDFGFLVRSGRAVLFPSTSGPTSGGGRPVVRTHFAREIVKQRAQDVRRALDYLRAGGTSTASESRSTASAWVRTRADRRRGRAPAAHARARRGGPRGRPAARGGRAATSRPAYGFPC